MFLLEQLKRVVGNTNIHVVSRIAMPNGNRVIIKLESENPSGSHYDRVYLRLFQELEHSGKITRGRTRLIETTSGSAGRSVAYFGKFLGYDVTIVVPSGLPTARVDGIRLCGAFVIEADGPSVYHAVKKMRQVLVDDKDKNSNIEDRFYCMNHSRDSRALEAMEDLAQEVKDYLHAEPLHYFIGACGNGTSLIGVGRRLKHIYSDIEVIGIEPEEACPIYQSLKLGKSGKVVHRQFRQHDVFGTGVPCVQFPFFEDPATLGVLDHAVLVDKASREHALEALKSIEGIDAGRSTALCFAAVKKLCEGVQNKTFLMILYDCLSKYY